MHLQSHYCYSHAFALTPLTSACTHVTHMHLHWHRSHALSLTPLTCTLHHTHSLIIELTPPTYIMHSHHTLLPHMMWGQYMKEIKCSSNWFRKFCDEFPCVRRYKSSAMSIMRAKKATPQVRDAHFKGFQDFLDRLQMEGFLSTQQRSELWKYLCCYDETSFDPDGCSRKRYLSTSQRYKTPKPKKKKKGKCGKKKNCSKKFR